MTENEVKEELSPTEHQQEAVDAMESFLLPEDKSEFFTLKGYGGTGKTFCVYYAVKGRRDVVGLALAHTAKDELASSLGGIPCMTLAKALNLKRRVSRTGEVSFVPDFRGRPKIALYKVIIVDECSMISEELFEYICMYKADDAKVIFLGDPAQLPPVSKTKSDFSVTFDYTKGELTVPVRYTGPLVDLGAMLRANILTDTPAKYVLNDWQVNDLGNRGRTSKVVDGTGYIFLRDPEDVIRISKMLLASNDASDYQLLAYTNKTINTLNHVIREVVYDKPYEELDQFMPNERVISNASYSIDINGSTHTVLTNNKTYTVKEFIKSTHKSGVKTIKLDLLPALDIPEGHYIETIDKSDSTVYDGMLGRMTTTAEESNTRGAWEHVHDYTGSWAQFSYSYGITIHKSQGKTYNNALVFESDIMDLDQSLVKMTAKLQALYVACTRARKIVFIYNKSFKAIQTELPADIRLKYGL